MTSHYIWSKVGGTADLLPYFGAEIHNDFSKKWGGQNNTADTPLPKVGVS